MQEADIQCYKQVAPTELQTYCFCGMLQTDCSYGALFILAPEERSVCRKIISLTT
ncbi:MAG: hypothetical protein AB1414_01610 [bacterium]